MYMYIMYDCMIHSHMDIILYAFIIVGDVAQVSSAKMVVHSCPFDASNTETKGTVLIKSAEELKNFSQGEEKQ